MESARHILDNFPAPPPPPPALILSSSTYLAHLALECAIKARLLHKQGVNSVDDLEKKHPKIHTALFRGKKGHDIQKLSTDVDLQGILKNEGRPLQKDACWTRIISSTRPYSLRYGTETLQRAEASEEISRISGILELLLSGLIYKK
ncbi:MAG TPA: hypothetical protein PLV42_05065 [bacterium]|nr:hypothetical protein [bacterium]